MLNFGATSPQQIFERGLAHHQAGQLAEAEGCYRQLLAQQPAHPDALHLLGVLACQVEQNEAAIDLIGRAVALDPRHAVYRSNLGEALRKSGQTARAEAEFRKSLALAPQFGDAYANFAALLLGQKRTDEAFQLLQTAMVHVPAHAGVLGFLGDVYTLKMMPQEAIQAYERALQVNPNLTDARYNLALSLMEAGQVAAAAEHFRGVMQLSPNDELAHLGLIEALGRLGKFGDAFVEIDRFAAKNDSNARLYSLKGNFLRTVDRVDDAIKAYERAVAMNDDWVPQANLAFAYRDQARIAECMALLRGVLEKHPREAAVRSGLIFSMHLDPGLTRADIRREQDAWNALHVTPLENRAAHQNDRSPGRALRVGYLSPDFRSHPVGRFMKPLLENHDPTQVQSFCYSTASTTDDDTRGIAKAAGQWREVTSLSDGKLADLIRADQIDILVDLVNHTIGNRMLVMGMKPAPVQISYLAYCAGTGVSTMDWRLTDAVIDPPGSGEDAPFETPLRMETYWCYAEHWGSCDVSELPMLSRAHVTFGSLNYFSKCNDGVLALWARLLAGMTDARLLLHVPTGSRQVHVRQFFRDRGVRDDQLEIVSRTNEKVYFARYREIDIALDPFPWAGGTTTCDALWMGVPMVTLAGAETISRGGASILTHIGEPGWIARSEEEYLAIARGLAADAGRLKELRAGLRERMRGSVLMDARRFAEKVEKSYRAAWRAWCAGHAP